MNVMGRFTFRNLKHNRTWAIVTIVGMIISTAMLTTVSTLTLSFVTLMRNEAIAETGNWHASLSGIREQDVQAIEEADYIGRVMRSRDIGYVRLEQPQQAWKPYLFIQEYDESGSEHSPVILTQGRMPENSSEIVLPQGVPIFRDKVPEVGDILTLEVGKRYIENRDDPDSELNQSSPYRLLFQEGTIAGRETFTPAEARTYTVVGLMERPSFEQAWSAGYTAVSSLDISSLNPEDIVNVKIQAQKINQAFTDRITDLAESLGMEPDALVFNDSLLRYYGLALSNNMRNMIYSFAAIVMLLIMAGSVVLIYNAFAMSVSERTRQLGILSSIGATKEQKRNHVYQEAAVLGAIGIPLGIAIGTAGITGAIKLARPLMDSFMTTASGGLQAVVSPASIVVTAMIAAVTILVSAWIPARRSSTVTPIDAIRQSREIRLTGKAVTTSRLMGRLFGLEADIALKNLKRNRRKYRITTLSLAATLILFLTAATFTAIANRSIELASTRMNYDAAIDHNASSQQQMESIHNQVLALDHVTEAAATEILSGMLLLEADQVTEPFRRLLEQNEEGKYILRVQLVSYDDESFASFAESIGLDPQDYIDPERPRVIVMNYSQYQLDGKQSSGEILSGQPGEPLILDITGAGSIFHSPAVRTPVEVGALTDQRPIGVDIPFVSGQYSPTYLAASKSIVQMYQSSANAAAVPLKISYVRSDDPDRLEQEFLEMSSAASVPSTMNNVHAEVRAARNTALLAQAFLYGFVALMSLISLVNMFNTLFTNIRMRRKEFAMLRSVGMTPASFNRMIRFESLLYSLKALLYGLPVAAAVSLLFYYWQRQALLMGYVFPWFSLAVAVVALFSLVMLTMRYASSRVNKISIIDTLKENM